MYDKDTFGIILSFSKSNNGQDIINLMITCKKLLDIGLRALESLGKCIFLAPCHSILERNDAQVFADNDIASTYLLYQEEIFSYLDDNIKKIDFVHMNKVDILESDAIFCCLDIMMAFEHESNNYIQCDKINIQKNYTEIISENGIHSTYKYMECNEMCENCDECNGNYYFDLINMKVINMYKGRFKFYVHYIENLDLMKKFSCKSIEGSF